MKSNVKRAVLVILTIVCGAAAGLAIYSYPRRSVASIPSLVPADDMVACLRLRGLGPLWRACSRSAFARKVFGAEISPLREMAAESGDFREKWEDLDLSYVPLVLGSDCVAALYREGDTVRPAAWSRIGTRVRLFHAWRRIRAALLFWREPRTRSARVGKLTVTSVLERRTGAPRFSYTLIGDLGIATTGSGEKFWPILDRLAQGKGGEGASAAYIPEPPPPESGNAGGFIFVRMQPLLESLVSVTGRLAQGEPKRWAPLEEALRRAGAAFKGWRGIEGVFSLGSRSGAKLVLSAEEGSVSPGAAGGARDPRQDILAGFMNRGGIAYAGGRFDIRRFLGRLRDRCGAARVVFSRRDGPVIYPAEHFNLSWIGDDCSVLLLQDERGMVNAAISTSVRDRRVAAARLRKFLSLADGAKVRVQDSRGRRLLETREALDIESKSGSADGGRTGITYRLGLGWPLEQLFVPVVALRGDRLMIATSDFVLREQGGSGVQAPEMWEEPSGAQFVLRGRDAGRAATSMRHILLFMAPFMEEGSERERLLSVCRLLGMCEWLAPLEEGWAAAVRDGNTVCLQCGARFSDIRQE